MKMTRLSTALVIVLLWTARALAGPELTPFGEGKPDAGFDLLDLQDTPHTLEDYRGKVVLVNFWAR